MQLPQVCICKLMQQTFVREDHVEVVEAFCAHAARKGRSFDFVGVRSLRTLLLQHFVCCNTLSSSLLKSPLLRVSGGRAMGCNDPIPALDPHQAITHLFGSEHGSASLGGAAPRDRQPIAVQGQAQPRFHCLPVPTPPGFAPKTGMQRGPLRMRDSGP